MTLGLGLGRSIAGGLHWAGTLERCCLWSGVEYALDSICHVFLTLPAAPHIRLLSSFRERRGKAPHLINQFRLFTRAFSLLHLTVLQWCSPGYFWHVDSLHFDSNFTIEGNTNDCECLSS